jgi:hypothetical protein
MVATHNVSLFSVILSIAKDLFYTMPVALQSSRIDASFLPMTGWRG